MPPRRRPPPISSAAALPSSRLPLGTPHLATSHSQDGTSVGGQSPTVLKSPATDIYALNKEKQAPSNQPPKSIQENDMAPRNVSDSATARSIAAAKLERQNKRNEEADPTMIHAVPLDKRTQQARAKKQKWQTFDYTSQPHRSTTPSDGGVSVTETRVNTFHAPSQASSLSRPVSVMSHRTSETGHSDMDRHDSNLTDQGFQIFQRRKNRRHGDLNAYEDKPEERQTTVEAAVDERKIYNVFGNALPGPDYIEANPGAHNGEIKFIQHPNGDVSARQWSAERFTWDNIGQFSNIRKKLEGQLAADRLKGETGYQASQKNTLIYFRIIAKQREANAMGRSFGAKEVNDAIPEPKAELSAAPTGLKESVSEGNPPEHSQGEKVARASPWNLDDYHSTHNPEPTPVPPSFTSHQPVPPVLGGIAYPLSTAYTPNHLRQEDPFYSNNSWQRIYGSQAPYSNVVHGQSNLAPHPTQATPSVQRPQGLNYGFHFPQIDLHNQGLPNASPFSGGNGAAKTGARQWQQSFGAQPIAPTSQGRPQYRTTGTVISSTDSDSTIATAATRPTGDAMRSIKPVTPLENRSALRDNLWKQAEAAKERSLSQGNILSRTVLYDPLQNSSPMTKVKPQEDSMKQDISPTLNRHTSRKALQHPLSIDQSSSWLQPRMIPPQPMKSASPESTTAQNLHDSSPDRNTSSQQLAYQAPVMSSPADMQLTPQNFTGPFFTGEQSHSGYNSCAKDQKTYDEQLADWWTSGQKFARQEEFYRSVTSTADRKHSTSITNSPAHLTPIGHAPTAVKYTIHKPEYNETTNRLLIPVLENLSSYVQGPPEKRRDYFSQWTQPPEWCIDRSETGNHSFFNKDWGTPPARVGRDPRYARSPWMDERTTPLRGRVGAVGVPSPGYGSFGGGLGNGIGAAGVGYVERRFGYGGSGSYWG